VVLDWNWIEIGLASDWNGLALDCYWIGARLTSDWHRIANGLAQDWLLIDIRLTLD
jgi:hypothetical protein